MNIPSFTAEIALKRGNEYVGQMEKIIKQDIVDGGNLVVPQLPPRCQPRCICWPDGCMCFWDCTRGYPI